jgi:hypothetical protein
MKTSQLTAAYIEAIYFTETGDGDQPSADATLSAYDKCKALNDCGAFMRAYREILVTNEVDPTQAGHDLWLTRNGHGVGVGFFDRPEVYGEELAAELTRVAQAMGMHDVTFNEEITQ